MFGCPDLDFLVGRLGVCKLVGGLGAGQLGGTGMKWNEGRLNLDSVTEMGFEGCLHVVREE
jgi:hypothetical protein